MRKSIWTASSALGFRPLLQRALTALLPQNCLLCGDSSGAVPLCPGCLQDLPNLPEPHCPICLEASTTGLVCGHCRTAPPHFDQAIALLPYIFPVDRLIQQYKYHAQLALAAWWGQALASRVPTDISLVVPLPLHPHRLAERGYNQAGELARHLASAIGRPLDRHAAQRCRDTRPQAELSLKARQNNLQGAFECRRELSNAHVLLVDDVLTSGATLNEMARVLKLHGASRVTACVVARTPLGP